MDKQAYALVLYSQGGYGCEELETAWNMKSEGQVRKIFWSSYNPEKVMKSAFDANSACQQQGIACFKEDEPEFYGEKLSESKKVRIRESEIDQLIFESIDRLLKK